eukprot:TRINITY_DN733_c0_g3_i1.p1 TRINITY_DN733_c0_g3~~TRINITY_DN733_c0_g3_i1.p1  ORF type:complete len:442 (+),score=92.46 TRINITY_DN733_c0_g3_i1:100-1425(+)
MKAALAGCLLLLASASLAAGQGLLVKIPPTGAEFTVYNIYHGPQHGLNVKMERLTILDAAGSIVTSHPLTGNNFIPKGKKIKVGSGYATRYSLTQTLAGGDIIFKLNMLIYTTKGDVTLPGYGTRQFKHTDFSWDFAVENKGAAWPMVQVDTLLSGPTQPSQHDRSRATDAWFPEGQYNRNFWVRHPKWYVADTRTHSMSSVTVAVGSQLWHQAQVSLRFGPVTKDLYYTTLLFGSLAYKRWCERSCFPGSASVDTLAGGRMPLAAVEVGDKVLVEMSGGERRYEEVLSFLHALPADEHTSNAFYALEHLHGELRASGNHVVFTADGEELAVSEVRPGDQLRFEGGVATSVVAVRESFGETGMYAPLTPAGSIVVDGVVASNYATVESLEIPHGAMHASFFFGRLLGKRFPATRQQEADLHPLATLYKDVLKLDRLLKLVS